MALDYKQMIKGVREALYGREVREWIAQLADYLCSLAAKLEETCNYILQQVEAAKGYASNAKTSANDAATSAGNASRSATAAANSASAAATSAANAKTSETKAQNSANSAKRYSDSAKDLVTEAKNEFTGGYYKTYNLTAAQSGWKALSPAIGSYAWYNDVSVPGLSTRYAPFCATTIESYPSATLAGLANLVETRTDCLRLYSMRKPTQDIDMVLTLFGLGTASYTLVLSPENWVKMSESIGPNQYRYDAPIAGCTKALIPLAMTDLEDFEAAAPAGMASVCETFDGFVRFYSIRVPADNVSVRVTLVQKDD